MLWMLAVALAACGGARATGRGASVLVAPALFAVETTVLVNDVARKDRELGYRLKAWLSVSPFYAHRDTLLLHFQLKSPELHLRGKHPNAEYLPRPSLWDDFEESSFFAHWEEGTLLSAYLDPQDPLDVLNYKKSLLSIFQFKSEDGEYNETDISGDCNVLYETVSDTVFRKIKKACAGDSSAASVRRVARYTLGAPRGPLRAVHAEELVAVGHAAPGLKARAWHALEALPPPAAPAPSAPSPEAALAALPSALAPTPLPLALAPDDAFEDDFNDDPDWRAAVEAHRAQLEREARGAGAGGDGAHADAALRLAGALRRAPASGLAALLRDGANHAIVSGLVRAMGACGTRAAFDAVEEVVQLRARDAPAPLAAAYLEAFSLAPAPEAAAVTAVLRAGEEARAPPLRASALMAAAAAAARLASLGAAGPSAAVKDSLLRSLARCKEEDCSAVMLRALANLRRADTVEALLEHAQRGAPAAALAALDALAAAPARALSSAHLQRLAHVARDPRAPLEVRAAALQLPLATWARVPLPHPIARMARALHDRGPHELRRFFWQRLRALTERHAELRALLPRFPASLRGWDAQALNGTSSVLQRDVGWTAAGWGAGLDSAQVAQGGLLRRGEVRLFARNRVADDADLVSVEMWTRGMETFAGGGDGGAGAAAPAAGLAFAVNGVRMRGVTLFEGQAELLGHVWSGTGSEPTPALRATVPLAEARGTQALATGVALRAAWRAGGAVAIDVHAQVSLWWRTARSALELRAAAVSHAYARVRTAWGEVRGEARAAIEPRLHIASDLDFYDKMALCVRVHTDDYVATRNTTLHSEQGGRRLKVTRVRREALPGAGRTLALGTPNDASCRTLRAADAPTPDE